MERTYILTPYVWNRQTGPLTEVTTPYAGVMVYCFSGTITVIINGTSLDMAAGEILDEGVIQGKTFEITGTGEFKGFLRGMRS